MAIWNSPRVWWVSIEKSRFRSAIPRSQVGLGKIWSRPGVSNYAERNSSHCSMKHPSTRGRTWSDDPLPVWSCGTRNTPGHITSQSLPLNVTYLGKGPFFPKRSNTQSGIIVQYWIGETSGILNVRKVGYLETPENLQYAGQNCLKIVDMCLNT